MRNAARTLSLIPLFVTSLPAASNAGLPHLWDATIVVDRVEIPFRFELITRNGEPAGAFFNGDERVRSSGGHWDPPNLTLEFDLYAARLAAKLEAGQLSGTYFRSGKQPTAFHAEPYAPLALRADDKPPSIAGQWDIVVNRPKGEAAWKFFVRQSGAEVTASILRVDGDTGTLSGGYRGGGKFVLSHFSGARPILVEVSVNADGTLALLQNGKAHYQAVKSAEARAKGLPEPTDPTRWTSVQDPTQPLRFHGTDLNGVTVTEADPRFRGKVVLLNITGSWCPNCHDEAPFLAALYRKYRGQGLEIVGLSFEEAEQMPALTRLRNFVKHYGIEYTMLAAGEPEQLKEKLPQAVNLNTFPATFFIGRDGLVRGAHAGFAGKATGEENKRQAAEFLATVEKLLAENTAASR